MDALVQGFELDDGEIHADAVSYVGTKKTEIGIEIHSGRNRIVRRMFEHLGYKVTKLDRVYFAGLTKQRLKRGEWRFLTPREGQALRSGQYELPEAADESTERHAIFACRFRCDVMIEGSCRFSG